MIDLWLVIALGALCGVSLFAAAFRRVAWPAYAVALLFPLFAASLTIGWAVSDCFNMYFEDQGTSSDFVVLSAYASMTVFCGGFVVACRSLSRSRPRDSDAFESSGG